MAAEAAQRERRLWLALGASAVLQVFTLALVVVLMAGQGRAPLPASSEALGRRSGRSLLQAADLLASSIKVGEKGDLVFDVPVTFSQNVDVNAMLYADWFKVDTLARIERLIVEDNIKTNTLDVTKAATLGGKFTVEELEVSGTSAFGTLYKANPQLSGVVLNVHGTGLFGSEQGDKDYYTEVAPGSVKTHWPGKDNSECSVGRSYGDVAAGLVAPPKRICG